MVKKGRIQVIDEEYAPMPSLGMALKIKISGQRWENARLRERPLGPWNMIQYLFRREKWRAQNEFAHYLNLIKKEPKNTKARLKLAEIYLKRGEKEKAISHYLRAAEFFIRKGLYPQAMAIYKRIQKQDPSLDHVLLKIAEIYRKMGFLGDAFSQYNHIHHHYNTRGMRDRVREVIGLMAELEPEKFKLHENTPGSQEAASQALISVGDSSEKSKEAAFFDLGAELEKNQPLELKGLSSISTEKMYGFEYIFKELKETGAPSTAYPNFHYDMGVACREMGFIDEAIEQFQIALKNGQSPFEAAKVLGLCFRDKGWWKEARNSFEEALKIEGLSEEKILDVKKELEFVCRELKKEEETLGFPLSPYDEGQDAKLAHPSQDKPNKKKTSWMYGQLMGGDDLLPGA